MKEGKDSRCRVVTDMLHYGKHNPLLPPPPSTEISISSDTFCTYVWLPCGKAHHGDYRPNYDGIAAPLANPITQVNCPPHPHQTIIAAKAILIEAQYPTNNFMCHMHHQAALRWWLLYASGMKKCMKEIE